MNFLAGHTNKNLLILNIALQLIVLTAVPTRSWGESHVVLGESEGGQGASESNDLHPQAPVVVTDSVCGVFKVMDRAMFLIQSDGKKVRMFSNAETREATAKVAQVFWPHQGTRLCFEKPVLKYGHLCIDNLEIRRVSKSGDALMVDAVGSVPAPQSKVVDVPAVTKREAPTYPYSFSEAPADNPLIRYMRNYPKHYGVLSGPKYRFKETRGSTLYEDSAQRQAGMQLEEWVRQRMLAGKGPFPSENPLPAIRSWDDFYQEHVRAAKLAGELPGDPERNGEKAQKFVHFDQPIVHDNEMSDGADLAVFQVKAPIGARIEFGDSRGNWQPIKARPVSDERNYTYQFPVATAPVSGSQSLGSRELAVRVIMPDKGTAAGATISSPVVNVPAGKRVRLEFSVKPDGAGLQLYFAQ